ncbi:MAG: DUF3810 family protein [Saprospiraceae bacterium]|nr:DUF3810 family protein [Saprospiraceae bacterium]
MRRYKDKFTVFSLILLILTVLMYLLFSIVSEMAEDVYGGVIYPFIRYAFDHTWGQSPVPFVYIVTIIMTAAFIFTGWSFKTHGLKKGLINLFNLLILLLALFFWTWGFNYSRANIKTRLEIQIPEVKDEALMSFFCELTEELPELRKKRRSLTYSEMEQEVLNSADRFFKSHHLPTPGKPRIRALYPEGVLLGISTAGIYIPYAFEAHFDAGLHHLVWPYVMSHELSHAFGITDEGECNFLASLICSYSFSPLLRYSGGLQDLRSVYYALVRSGHDPKHLSAQISEDIRSDIRNIREKHDSFPSYFPEFLRDWIYDNYLKSQGIKSGLSSYREDIGLLIAWRERTKEN